MPFLSFPKEYPRYVPRALMVAYLERYAQYFGLAPRFNEAVQDIRRDGANWVVESESTTVRAPFVLVVSGDNAEPVIPPVPGLQKFNGSVSHSADYRNAAQFSGKSVRVIGMGNTGAEIALDLAENCAQPTI
jgi:cation diffusion facilitator CzcD-associated flavoprotein CzcO